MMSLKQIQSAVDLICRSLVGVAFLVLIVAVLIQVLGRSFGSSPVWTEELTRFALLYLAAFGVGLSLRSGDLVNVDVICEFLPGKWPRRLRLFSAAITSLLCLVLIVPAWKYTSIGVRQTSPAMGLRMDFVHASVMILLIILLAFAALRVVLMVWAGESGLPEKSGADT